MKQVYKRWVCGVLGGILLLFVILGWKQASVSSLSFLVAIVHGASVERSCAGVSLFICRLCHNFLFPEQPFSLLSSYLSRLELVQFKS